MVRNHQNKIVYYLKVNSVKPDTSNPNKKYIYLDIYYDNKILDDSIERIDIEREIFNPYFDSLTNDSNYIQNNNYGISTTNSIQLLSRPGESFSELKGPMFTSNGTVSKLVVQIEQNANFLKFKEAKHIIEKLQIIKQIDEKYIKDNFKDPDSAVYNYRLKMDDNYINFFSQTYADNVSTFIKSKEYTPTINDISNYKFEDTDLIRLSPICISYDDNKNDIESIVNDIGRLNDTFYSTLFLKSVDSDTLGTVDSNFVLIPPLLYGCVKDDSVHCVKRDSYTAQDGTVYNEIKFNTYYIEPITFPEKSGFTDSKSVNSSLKVLKRNFCKCNKKCVCDENYKQRDDYQNGGACKGCKKPKVTRPPKTTTTSTTTLPPPKTTSTTTTTTTTTPHPFVCPTYPPCPTYEPIVEEECNCPEPETVPWWWIFILLGIWIIGVIIFLAITVKNKKLYYKIK